MSQEEIHIRPYEEDQDFNFVQNAWLLSSHDSFPNRFISKNNYNTHTTPIIKALIACSKINIACNVLDHNHIFGFIAYEFVDDFEINIIHFVYVKKAVREFGIALQLIQESLPSFMATPTLITAMPQKKMSINNPLEKFNLIYDPYIISRRMSK